ncbi:MAG: hypothetical protein J6X59_00455 [Bacteroidales bacterium]|nr:hypothetical protein [Bacteroidales bacterium]
MATKTLYRMSRVGVGRESADSVARSKAINMNDRSRGQEILMEAQGHRSAAYKYLKDRDRNKRYNYGDQWSDVICVDGVRMTEEEYIKRQGNVPLKNNLIRRLTKNVIGSFRDQQAEPICLARDRDEQKEAETLSTLLQYNRQLNRMGELEARGMEEFLISGMVAHEKTFGWRNDREDCWTDNVPPDAFIPDSKMTDFRGWDCSFVGRIHDYDRTKLMAEFAKSPADYQRLDAIYAQARSVRGGQYTWEDFGYSHDSARLDFLTPVDPSLCRVIEVWRKESKPRYRCHDWNSGEVYKIDIEDYNALVKAENARRKIQAAEAGIPMEEVPFITVEWFMDSYWYYYFLTPMGDILREGETPYHHKSHPFVFKMYPFIDGEIHSFVSDVIDQQRYTNRLIVLEDFIIRASAKGTLMIPEDVIPDGMSPQDFADTWVKFNGVIVYKPSTKHSHVPQQISANSTNIGIHELLSLQLKFFEDISGVNGVMQGKASFAGESGSHAQAMMQSAATSLVDIFASFNDFQEESAYKDIKNIQQCYDEKKVLNIVGRTAGGLNVDPTKVLNTEVDISVSPSRKTPIHRALANDFFIKLFEMQAIDVEQLLESVSDIPYADELLQSIRSKREQMANGQTPEPVSPELMQKVQQGLNPNTESVERMRGLMPGWGSREAA